MKTNTIFTVTAEVTANDSGDLKRKIRQIRKDLKTILSSHNGIKILTISNEISVE